MTATLEAGRSGGCASSQREVGDTLLSIVIVSWNVKQLLRDCLRSVLADAAASRIAVEVIVVDNASHDGSIEMVRREFPAAIAIANRDNVGFGRANNEALPLARGKYVLLLNPDTIVESGALSSMMAILDARDSVVAVGARLVNTDGSLQRWTGGAFPTLKNVACHYLFVSRLLPRAMQPVSLYLDKDPPGDLDVDWVSGACLLLRRNAVGDVIFDPGFFMYGEDMELCHRLQAAGGTIVYTPRASVVHHQGASIKQQKGDVLLSTLKGPRRFFGMTQPRYKVVLFDALTVTGFFLRWIAYGIVARARGSAVYRQRAASSRQYMTLALRVIRGD